MKKYVELKMNNLVMRGYENIIDKKKCVVMFHGFTGNKTETNRMFFNIEKKLDQEQISSLRFDWFGHGESELDFSLLNVDLLLDQAATILEYTKKKFQEVYLLGFSMGGALAINSLKYIPQKLILISPAVNMTDIATSYYNNCEKIGENFVDLHGLKLSKEFVESFKELEYQENLNNYERPVLLIHGTKDLSVPIENNRSLYANIKKKIFLEIEGADHGYSKVKYMNIINQEIVKFIKKEF